MNNVKKVAAAVAMAIGAAGTGVVQSDIVDYGYGASSSTVHTINSVVNLESETPPQQETLHWRYFYKSGSAASDKTAVCEEVNFTWSTSPYDLVTVSADGYFGVDSRGIMFNDPMVNVGYDPSNVSLALLQNITKPIRFKTFVDNNDGAVAQDNTLTAARTTIFEVAAGAAWGFAGYNPSGNSWNSNNAFAEVNEVFGEVLGPANGPSPNGPGEDGVDISVKPFDEFATVFFVQPIAHDGNTNDQGAEVAYDQRNKNLEVVVTISVSDYTSRPGDAMFDRDENPVSSNVYMSVTCIGAVTIQDVLTQGAEDLLEDTGGWGEFKTRPMTLGTAPVADSGTRANEGRIRTQEAVVEFLEHNDPDGDSTGSTVDGEDVGGVVNNGYQLAED